MKNFYCSCGQRVFFENTQCLNCDKALGFDPLRMEMITLNESGDHLLADDGTPYKHCENRRLYDNCNWLLPADSSNNRCLSCGMNQVIPALDKPENLLLWTRVEEAKRRLVYSLIKFGLPFTAGNMRLGFRIMEDKRSNPEVLESFIATGHRDGTITINVAEADDAIREAIREQLMERYRTVLGHLRHEAGHFYFGVLVQGDLLEECRALFGDETENYDDALECYYANGASADWHKNFVSAYASAHPAEDFAETFAHVLHIDAALETARWSGLTQTAGVFDGSWLDDWVSLALTLNEVLRSLGSEDPYPFVLTNAVRRKLHFVGRLVTQQAGMG